LRTIDPVRKRSRSSKGDIKSEKNIGTPSDVERGVRRRKCCVRITAMGPTNGAKHSRGERQGTKKKGGILGRRDLTPDSERTERKGGIVIVVKGDDRGPYRGPRKVRKIVLCERLSPEWEKGGGKPIYVNE